MILLPPNLKQIFKDETPPYFIIATITPDLRNTEKVNNETKNGGITFDSLLHIKKKTRN